jgi:diguanylate cyclase (GGDEF)-like protein
MSGAQVAMMVNIALGSLFAVAYAIIALSNKSQRRALWFSVGYLLGMAAPACDLIAPLVGAPELLEDVGYTSFLMATLSISATFSIFYRRPPPWPPILLILALGVALRLWIWSLPPNTLVYGIAYQLPFSLASILATRSVLAVRPHRALHLALAGVFALISAHFMVKPPLAVAFGPGASHSDYVHTAYALFSQASTGVLLLAAGIFLLLVVAQRAINESQLASETDPLSGIANRRGFDRLAQEALSRAQHMKLAVSVAIFDLDHFKRINDTFGHSTGDAVIVAFARLLRATAPVGGVVGRQGGEEFALLIAGATVETAWLGADAVRIATAQQTDRDLPRVTVSGGVAQLRRGETLSELLRRADQASYQAKHSGRDRICVAAHILSESGAPEAFPDPAFASEKAASAARQRESSDAL